MPGTVICVKCYQEFTVAQGGRQMQPCPNCAGSARVESSDAYRFEGRPAYSSLGCPKCFGTRRVEVLLPYTGRKICPSCELRFYGR
jgi:DnaJ-class molecular chaperone